mmetsp:Transcript_7261/g.27188  ORF Transcript_7261/g.27188 Transcript_7261/m.27188 type:complete len:195 (-) Transcript_7261:191-775(-)|eukprot:CAMPEP_0117447726 /NCGR_PEP_ID=MMETSP0759-20121206/7028_1 /TAXON_ID=63605 /ORGANISM="Percolomonas cosmopolitus, Strain WS" /LENGTH=194 /DNA_ID=CAMNT_0005240079 /DNA_START=232 /DNA_END=816 /DNA_ORIENTATION=-
MGQWLTTLLNQFHQKDLDICICGLPESGKSTLTKAITSYTQNQTASQHIFASIKPSVSVQLGKFHFGRVRGCIYDIAGQIDQQQTWKQYVSLYSDVAIFVIDTANHAKFDMAKRRLHEFLRHVMGVKEEATTGKDVRVIIVFNKIDVEGHASAQEMETILDYGQTFPELQIVTKETSAVQWKGIGELLDFLVHL